ncbi:MAG: carotenoid oxygenase family protein [Caulobacteraceae bacterium]
MNKPVTRYGREAYVPVQSYLHTTIQAFRFEAEIFDCEVVGEVPRELNGSFYRCGGDHLYPTMENDNLNNGDGVMAAFHFEDGYVDFIQRYVKTERFLLERKNRRRLYGAYRNGYADDPQTAGTDRDNTGNTTAFVHHGKLFALREDSIPYELDPITLETLGLPAFRSQLRTKTMSAHPKIDPVTGEWWSYGQFSEKRFEGEMSLHVIDKDGQVIREEEFSLPYPGMTHDWAVTREHLIFHILPYTVDTERLKTGGDFYAFDASRPPMFGIMPRSGTTQDLRWFPVPGAGVAHFMNAFTEGDKVQVDGSTHSGHFFTFFEEVHGRRADFEAGTFSRITFDLATGEVSVRPLSNSPGGGMPEVDDRFAMLPYRYGYSSSRTGLVRYDTVTGGRQDYETEGQAQEPVFVPRSPEAPEGDGFLLSVVARPGNRADLVILDAMKMDAEPLAVVRLPFSQPWLFHGAWRDGAASLPR